MTPFVAYDVKKGVGTITLNRPDRFNALGPTLAHQLKEVLLNNFAFLKYPKKKFSAPIPSEPRCLIIRANPVFSKKQNAAICIAGGDLKELAHLKKRDALKYVRDFAQICLWLEKLPIPVITVVEGTCIGGGVELFLAGDIRICTKNSTFHFRQLEIGLPTGYGSTQRMLKLFGHSRTQFLLYTSSHVTSETSIEIGLSHFLCADQKILKKTLEFQTQRLMDLSWEAWYCQKRFINMANKNYSHNDIMWETKEFAKVWLNNKHKSFVLPYFEKKKN